jgi:carbonic anhydrase
VIGVLINKGNSSADFLKTIASNVKATANEKTTIPLDFSQVLRDIGIGNTTTPYFAYPGSFTTPPCTEGVQWIMLQKPITMTKEDVDALQKIQKLNFRPPQPLNSRTLTAAY